MLNYILPLLKPSFWFDLYPLPFTPWADRIILGVMALLLLAAVGLKIWSRRPMDHESRHVFARFAVLAFWAGLSGLMLYGFEWQRIPVLSMRLWFLVWLVGFGWWKWTIIRYARKEVPALRKNRAAQEAYEKWLPKPKGK